MPAMQTFENRAGVTLVELKQLLSDWPEIDAEGELTRVWIETGEGLSSLCVAAFPLNVRGEAAAVLLEPLRPPAGTG